MHRFFYLNGHLRADVVWLAHALGEAASTLFSPGNPLVVDESLYEFNGQCPVRRYIPRKPHPNGLLVYGLAGFINVGVDRIPIVLDFEPYTSDNQVGAQEAMIRLHSRLRQRYPHVEPHLVVDSAFGSFDRLADIRRDGGHATMSMSPTVKPWLWEMLDWNCGIDEGRAALLPLHNVVVSSFKVVSETGTIHQIKTISSGCAVNLIDETEWEVIRVLDRRTVEGDQLEYLAHFSTGHEQWLLTRDFVDDDGAVNMAWLDFSTEEDLKSAFTSYTLSQLKVQRLPDLRPVTQPFP